MKAQRVLDGARRLLTDAASVRWSDGNLLTWLNEGQLQIAQVIPAASSKRATIDKLAGLEQSIPASDGIRLLSVLHNINTDGSVGRVVTVVTRDEMNAIRVMWPGIGATAVTKHIVFDDDQPKIFEVWPPSTVGAKLRIAYSALPTDCTQATDDLGIDGIYAPALTDWVCYRAYMEDSDDAADGQRAANHLSAFQTGLGTKVEVDKTAVPKRK